MPRSFSAWPALVLQNLGPAVRFDKKNENLPLNLRAGAAYRFKACGHENLIALDITEERGQGALLAAGGETRLLEPLALRLGFSTRNEAGIEITAGFGYQFKSESIDYAFVPMGGIGNAHRISITLRWG